MDPNTFTLARVSFIVITQLTADKKFHQKIKSVRANHISGNLQWDRRQELTKGEGTQRGGPLSSETPFVRGVPAVKTQFVDQKVWLEATGHIHKSVLTLVSSEHQQKCSAAEER